ncbi:MAG: reverse transcriptase domain-containing protein [Candidatus Izemoplasmatales bacterium]
MFRLTEESFSSMSKLEVSRCINGAYNKFKYLVYYNSTYLIYKKRIAEFESFKKEDKLERLINFIQNDMEDEKYLNQLISMIDYYPIVKKEENNQVKLNYFIDVPVEIHIIDVLWTILVVASSDFDDIEKCWYGNIIDKKNLFVNGKENRLTFSDINWESPNLFRKYIYDYNRWINDSVNCIKQQKGLEDHLTLFSTDLSRYYYSTDDPLYLFLNFQYTYISSVILNKLTDTIKIVYRKYNSKIKNFSTMEMGRCITPIGLTSSMFVANAYLTKFDMEISDREDVKYYGRYVDDIIVVFAENYSREQVMEILHKAKDNHGYNFNFNKDKTMDFHYENYNYLSELERLFQYINAKKGNYYGNEDEEELSFRRYFEFEKNTLKNNLISNGNLREGDFINLDFNNIILFMNYIYDTVNFKRDTLEDVFNKIMTYIKSTFKFSMWKEIYRWVKIFCPDKGDFVKQCISERILHIQNIDILEVGRNYVSIMKEKLVSTYDELNNISKILGGFVDKNSKLDLILDLSGMCKKDSIVKYLIKNYQEGKKLYDNSSEFYEEYYGLSLPFVHLWEILIFDQMVNLSKKNKKTFEESIETFKKINGLVEFEYIKIDDIKKCKNIDFYEIGIKENKDVKKTDIKEYIVSHPNIDLKTDKVLPIRHSKPSVESTRIFMRNLLLSIEDKSSTLVLPELYVKLEWLNIIAQVAHQNQFNVTFGLESLVLGRRFYNLIFSLYCFKDIHLRKNLFITIREKNFYSYDEISSCKKQKLTCRNPFPAKYYLVNNKNISFVDYLCFEITDIISRSLYKGSVDLIIIPMLNKDTTYFDNIIQSLSRDLSCCVVTANSASWGNSSVILPRASYKKILTEFKGGFNNYLVSSKIPIYELIYFNKNFKYNTMSSLEFKKHPANYNYENKSDE